MLQLLIDTGTDVPATLTPRYLGTQTEQWESSIAFTHTLATVNISTQLFSFLFVLSTTNIRVTAKTKVTNMNRISTARKWNRPVDVTDLEYRSNEKSSRCQNDNWKRKNMTRRTRPTRLQFWTYLSITSFIDCLILRLLTTAIWHGQQLLFFFSFYPPTNSRRKEKGKQKWNTRGVSLLLVWRRILPTFLSFPSREREGGGNVEFVISSSKYGIQPRPFDNKYRPSSSCVSLLNLVWAGIERLDRYGMRWDERNSRRTYKIPIKGFQKRRKESQCGGC